MYRGQQTVVIVPGPTNTIHAAFAGELTDVQPGHDTTMTELHIDLRIKILFKSPRFISIRVCTAPTETIVSLTYVYAIDISLT